jgi:hypothetical protein
MARACTTAAADSSCASNPQVRASTRDTSAECVVLALSTSPSEASAAATSAVWCCGTLMWHDL